MMSEVVLAHDDLDAYASKRVDTILVGRDSGLSDPIHIPSSQRWMEPVCQSGSDWTDHRTTVYTQRSFCPDCIEQEFGVEVVSDE